MAPTDCRRKRSENYKERERPNSKRQLLGKEALNWSGIPCDVVECIIGHLCWADRIRMQAVCKAWSVPSRHIPAIDKFPWALERYSYWLLDPFSGDYVREKLVGGKERLRFIAEQLFGRSAGPLDVDALVLVPLASAYGWIFFRYYRKCGVKPKLMFFLYSPFTSEIIKLPELKQEEPLFQVSGFSLNATSPECFIFILTLGVRDHKIHVNLCSPGDISWRTFEFNSGIEPGEPNWAVSAVYANGVFYCVFRQGELGAFNVKLEDWTILGGPLPPRSFSTPINLLVIDADLWDLNSHVLFLGRSSFAVPAVGETSELANTIVSCDSFYRSVRCYGSTSCENRWSSLLYRKCVEAAKCVMIWIQLPSRGIWTADDLIHAA
ncbi:hypothetical protein V6N13_129540 [Hibiscus sabdariffa]